MISNETCSSESLYLKTWSPRGTEEWARTRFINYPEVYLLKASRCKHPDVQLDWSWAGVNPVVVIELLCKLKWSYTYVHIYMLRSESLPYILGLTSTNAAWLTDLPFKEEAVKHRNWHTGNAVRVCWIVSRYLIPKQLRNVASPPEEVGRLGKMLTSFSKWPWERNYFGLCGIGIGYLDLQYLLSCHFYYLKIKQSSLKLASESKPLGVRLLTNLTYAAAWCIKIWRLFTQAYQRQDLKIEIHVAICLFAAFIKSAMWMLIGR